MASGSNLDHIWVNKQIITRAGVLYFDITDHLPTFVHFGTNEVSPASTTFRFRPFHDSDLRKFIEVLAATNWDDVLLVSDVDTAWKNFEKFLNETYCKFFPAKSKILSEKRVSNPWLSTYVKKLINLKSEYFRLYRRGLISRESNNILKNSVNREVDKAKTSYYNKILNETRSNSKRTWNLIDSLLGKSSNASSREITLKYNDTTINDSESVANRFIEFFSGIARNLDSNLGSQNASPTSNIPVNRNSFFLFPVSEGEVSKLIGGLRETKTDINTIPVKIFKAVSPCLLYPICKLINFSLAEGFFPNHLKLSRITPIFKSGDKQDPSNYRPISSLPFLSKILERSMTNRLINFFNKFSLFSCSQFGFLKGKKTTDALINLTEEIYESLDDKEHHISVLIDLKKAFDTVNHEILLSKLERYGVRSLALQWFKSYLLDRESYVGLGTTSSQRSVLNIGVPQGSIIGPILFLIYINDLPNSCPNLNVTLFADDTTLSYSSGNHQTLYNDVNAGVGLVREWTVSNRLTINHAKTECIYFSNRGTMPRNDHILLGGNPLTFVPHCTFLGVVIDERLTFGDHIDLVLKRVISSSRILYQIRKYLPLETRLKYYYSFIYPQLSYAILIWGNTAYSHLRPLVLQHKRIIRLMTDSGPFDHTTPLFKRLKLLKLTDIYEYHLLLYMHKSMKNNMYQIQHSLDTRFRNLAAPKYHRLSGTQRAVSFSGPTLWNKLPSTLRDIRSYANFKSNLKSYYVEKYPEL